MLIKYTDNEVLTRGNQCIFAMKSIKRQRRYGVKKQLLTTINTTKRTPRYIVNYYIIGRCDFFSIF